jgi:hypothetical protein
VAFGDVTWEGFVVTVGARVAPGTNPGMPVVVVRGMVVVVVEVVVVVVSTVTPGAPGTVVVVGGVFTTFTARE